MIVDAWLFVTGSVNMPGIPYMGAFHGSEVPFVFGDGAFSLIVRMVVGGFLTFLRALVWCMVMVPFCNAQAT